MRRAYKQRRAIFIGWGSRGGISELLAVAGGTAVSIVESVSVLNVCNLFVVLAQYIKLLNWCTSMQQLMRCVLVGLHMRVVQTENLCVLRSEMHAHCNVSLAK